MKLRSISIKIALAATAFAIGILLALSALEVLRIKADFRDLVSRQQFAFVSNEAREIDQKLMLRQRALELTAAVVAGRDPTDAAALQAALDHSPALEALFDRIVIIRADGKIAANHPFLATANGISVVERPYFQEALAGHGNISTPFRTKLTGEPAVFIAVPVRDRAGAVTMVLTGQLNLLRRNFLGVIGEAKVGETGFFTIFTRDRMMLMSPDKRRIMTPGPAPKVSAHFDRVMAGHEGSEEATSSHGLRAIFSYKQLSAAPWALVAVMPVEEAYAPAVQSQRRMAALTLVVAVLVSLVAWLGARRLVRPIVELRDATRAMRENPEVEYSASFSRNDEIGDLAHHFESLMRERAASEARMALREAQLRDSEERLRTITDNLPVPISYVGADEQFRFANATLGEWLDVEPASLVGHSLRERFGAKEYARIAPHVAEVLAGKPVTHERQASYAGVVREVRSVYIPDFDAAGRVRGFYTLVHDITDSKILQRKLTHSAQHDVLTGLANRALFEDRLSHALAVSARSGRMTGLMYLDLDRFKSINDTYGHEGGDTLLKEFAQRLSRCVRATDTVARLGGDEFTIVLEGLTKPDDAIAVAEKIIFACTFRRASALPWRARMNTLPPGC